MITLKKQKKRVKVDIFGFHRVVVLGNVCYTVERDLLKNVEIRKGGLKMNGVADIFRGISGVTVVLVLLVFFILVLCVMGYVKAPPDRAFIISGFRKKPRILIGRAGIRIPFLERKDVLIMKQITVDIKTNSAVPTKDFIGVEIDAVAKIAVDYDPKQKEDDAGINLAMKNFLNMSEQQIVQALTDSLQGNLREIIGTVELRELNTDRKKFGDEVQEKAQIDMKALGIKIISCNIQTIKDEQNLINELGQDNMSKIKKDASIARAQADRDVRIAEAEAGKAANDAKVMADTEIAIRNNELAVKKAELKKEADARQAEADAVSKIVAQEQRKTIEIKTSEAEIAKQEKEIELKEKEAKVKERELEATVKRQAEAQRYKVEQESDAELYKRQKQAEAQKYEQLQSAEAEKIKADAMKYTREQEAAGIAAVGKAEAEAIRAKALAEAEGIEAKAEAQRKMGEASVFEMYFNAMPKIAEAVASPLKSVDSITMYGDGNTAKMVGDVTKAMTQILNGVKDSTGVDLSSALAGFLGGKLLTDSADASGTDASDDSVSEKEQA